MPYVVHVVQQSDFAQSTYANICIFQIYVQQLKTMFIPQCEPLGAESSKWVDILIQFIFIQINISSDGNLCAPVPSLRFFISRNYMGAAHF